MCKVNISRAIREYWSAIFGYVYRIIAEYLLAIRKIVCGSSFFSVRVTKKTGEAWDQTHGPFAMEVSKGAKIRNRYNQEPHLTQDTNGKVTHSR